MSMQKVSSVTLWAGCQSLNGPSSDPMKNLPPGTRTVPSGHEVGRAAGPTEALAMGTAAATVATPALGRAAMSRPFAGVPNMR